MKTSLRILFTFLTILLVHSLTSFAQNVFSRFDFLDFPLEAATIGPNGVSIDADATTDGGAYILSNCGGLKGIDLQIPNPGNLFDKSSLGMGFGFRKVESRSDFFVRGGTSFYQSGGQIYVQYRTTNGAGGFTDYGPFNTGFSPPMDGSYHEYIFVYQEALGTAYVTVDGTNVWNFDGPDNRPLYWTGAPNAMVGTVMDGNCPGFGVLDYAFFFDPDTPLEVDLQSFEGIVEGQTSELSWKLDAQHNAKRFNISRSHDGNQFDAIAEVQADLMTTDYTYSDLQPGEGLWYYRLETIDLQGYKSISETVELIHSGIAEVKVWPNPSAGHLNLEVPKSALGQEISLHNAQGVRVLSTQLSNQSAQLELQDLAPGIYFLQVMTGNEIQEKRIVLQ